MTIKFTAANLRTIAAHGEAACLEALRLHEKVGEGPCMIGGNDARLGNNLINAGRAIAARNAASEAAFQEYFWNLNDAKQGFPVDERTARDMYASHLVYQAELDATVYVEGRTYGDQ